MIGSLEVIARDVVTENAARQLVVLEERCASEADEGGVRQRQAHVSRELSGLRAVRLIREDDDVIALAVRGRHGLIEFMNEAEDEPVIVLQEVLEHSAGTGPWRRLVSHVAADERAPDLVVEVFAISHNEEREVPRHDSSHLLDKEGHGVRLAAPLRVPEDAETPQVWMGPRHKRQLFSLDGRLRVRRFDQQGIGYL